MAPSGPEGGPVEQWGADRIHELADLVVAAAPDEDLTADELLTGCYDHPGTVLAPPDGSGAVAVGIERDAAGHLVAVVRLLAVHPDRRRQGVAGRLLDAAEAWGQERGAERIVLGGGAFALWPGVEPTGALAALARRRGYEVEGMTRSFTVPVTFRAPPPPGVVVRRVVRDGDVVAVTLAVAEWWPRWSDEVARALDHGTCHAAFPLDEGEAGAASGDDGTPTVLGVGCHSITRATWVGPLSVSPGERRRGIGAALLGQVCRDLMIAEFRGVEVHGVDDPVTQSFVVSAGAVSRGGHARLAKPLER